MKPSLPRVGRLGVLAGLVWASVAPAQTPVVPVELSGAAPRPPWAVPTRARLTAPVPLDALPVGWREKVGRVVQSATLSAHAPPEEFRAGVYDWLLDHPDRVALAWRRLGVPCIGITDLGQGRFNWVDGLGSDITWVTVYRSGEARVWYADGRAKVSPMLPVMPVRAVAVLRYVKHTDADGQFVVTHEVDVYLQTDSKMAVLVTKLIGPAAPRLAEQGATQLLLFFSALARHLDQHPEQVPALLAGTRGQRTEDRGQTNSQRTEDRGRTDR